MHEYLQDPEKMKNHLIRRLDSLLTEMHMLVASPTEQTRIRGNCNEIEIMLVEFYGLRMADIDLMEAKAWQEHRYLVGKHGGYCLTGDGNGNHWWLKGHERVDSDALNFRLPDNGIGDKLASKAEAEFRKWIAESGIEEAEWLRKAGVTLPKLGDARKDDNDNDED